MTTSALLPTGLSSLRPVQVPDQWHSTNTYTLISPQVECTAPFLPTPFTVRNNTTDQWLLSARENFMKQPPYSDNDHTAHGLKIIRVIAFHGVCRFCPSDVRIARNKHIGTVAMFWEIYPVYNYRSSEYLWALYQQDMTDVCTKSNTLKTEPIRFARVSWTDLVSDGWTLLQ